jgi:hypothetical protein
MATDVVDTINFVDAVSGDNACLVVRVVNGKVGLCLSLIADGDVEAWMPPQVADALIRALTKAADSTSG